MRSYSRFSVKNAQNFIAMATSVDLGQILTAPWDQLPSKTPEWCKHLGSICYRSGVIANFVPKNVDFSYPPLFDPKFGNLSVGLGRWCLASKEGRCWANYWYKYFSEFSTYVITVQS